MGKFAVLTFRCIDEQSQIGNGVMGRAIKFFKDWRADRSIRPIGTIAFKDNALELGYIIQLPGFIINWDRLSPNRRKKKLLRYLRLLEKLDIDIVCIPYYWSILPEEVIEYMEKRFVLDDGYDVRIFALMDCLKYLTRMLKNRLLNMEVGIWGADSQVGKLFAQSLAPYVNNMVLGGTSSDALYELADEVMRETGLACPITTDVDWCLKDRRLVVMTQRCDPDLLRRDAIVVYAGGIDLKYIEAMGSHPGPFWILSGWAALPEKIEADIEPLPWETLGVLQALFFLRREISEISDVLAEVKMRGFISIGGGITYDTFRIRYFRKRT